MISLLRRTRVFSEGFGSIATMALVDGDGVPFCPLLTSLDSVETEFAIEGEASDANRESSPWFSAKPRSENRKSIKMNKPRKYAKINLTIIWGNALNRHTKQVRRRIIPTPDEVYHPIGRSIKARIKWRPAVNTNLFIRRLNALNKTNSDAR